MLEFRKGAAFPLPPVNQEGVTFSVEPYTMMLVYRFAHPTQEERNAFACGQVQFAVTVIRDVIFVLSRFAPLTWTDAPYSTHLSSSQKKFPDLKPGQGYAIDAFLVDCETNLLAEHRLMHLDTASSEQIRKIILEDQAKENFSLEKFNAEVAEIYRGYQTKDLLKLAQFQTKPGK